MFMKKKTAKVNFDPYLKEMSKKNWNPPHREDPADTTVRVKAVLAQLSGKDYTVLATYKASKGPAHEIRMGSNGAVYCTGKCWQYSKSGTCKHLDHFRAHCVVQKFGRIEK